MEEKSDVKHEYYKGRDICDVRAEEGSQPDYDEI